jgi:hypothetical protein
MQTKIVLLILLLPVLLFANERVRTAIPAQKKGTTFKLNWDYRYFPVKIQVYDLKNPKIAKVGGMGRLNSIANSFLASPVATDKLFVPNNDRYTFALVVENTTSKKLYFHVVPHELTPEEYSLGAKFNCLCYGHIYSVPPGKVWYRIVSLQNSTPQLGTDFNVRHKVIGLDEKYYFKDAKDFQESGP